MSLWSSPTLSLVALVCAVFFWRWLGGNGGVSRRDLGFAQADDGAGVPPWASTVKRSKVVGFGEFRREAFTGPVVVRHSPLADWPAVHQWSEDVLCEKVEMLGDVQRTMDWSQLFVYEDNGRLFRTAQVEAAERGKMEEMRFVRAQNIEKVTMGCKEFLRSERPVYMSGPIDDKIYEGIIKDVGGNLLGTTGDTNTTHLSISRVGTITGLHFDLADNIFAQVHGCKRFIIADPSAWKSTHQFPFFHPNDRQSQLEVMDELDPHFSEMEQIPIEIADLSPGEFLYLPGFYFHRVLAFPCFNTTTSVSVNTWIETGFSSVAQRTKSFVPPYFIHGVEEDDEILYLSTARYIQAVVNGLTKGSTGDFVQKYIINQRYSTSEAMRKGLGCDMKLPKCNYMYSFDERNVELVEKLRERASDMVKLFNSETDMPRTVRDLILADWVERVAILAVRQDITKLCAFLSECIVNQS